MRFRRRNVNPYTGNIFGKGQPVSPSATLRKPRSKPAKTVPVAPAKEPVARAYHHGALREALLEGAERILRRDGLRSLTLRQMAREVGVSHTAPVHHFGDTAGVLSELAARGHLRLAAGMFECARGIEREEERRRAIARAYIGFAVEQPDLFRLMSRFELLDQSNETLNDARRKSIRALAGVFEDRSAAQRPPGRIEPEHMMWMVAAWSYVHGLASLLIDGRLDSLPALSGFEHLTELVETTIDRVRIAIAEQ